MPPFFLGSHPAMDFQHPSDAARRVPRAHRRRGVVCRVAPRRAAAAGHGRTDAQAPLRRRGARCGGRRRRGSYGNGPAPGSCAGARRRAVRIERSPPSEPIAGARTVLSGNGPHDRRVSGHRAVAHRFRRCVDRSRGRTRCVAGRDRAAGTREALCRPRVHAVVRRSHESARPIVLQRNRLREPGEGCGVPRTSTRRWPLTRSRHPETGSPVVAGMMRKISLSPQGSSARLLAATAVTILALSTLASAQPESRIMGVVVMRQEQVSRRDGDGLRTRRPTPRKP